MKLLNKRAIVTGGSRGIGRAIVEQLAKEGCSVVFTYYAPTEELLKIEEENAKKVELELNTEQVKIIGFIADAASFKAAENTVNFTLEKLGGIDILVNNVGITKDNLLLRMSEEDFDLVLNVNLKSVFNYTKAAVKSMISQKYGKIVNISSVVGIIGNAGQANYVASKAGIIGLTKSNAKEFASRNINVNAVAPGFIETDMTKKLTEQQREAYMNFVPMKRFGTPEDVAKVVAFLCSDDANYITGQVIPIDGGMVM